MLRLSTGLSYFGMLIWHYVDLRGLIVLSQHLEVALGMVADGANFRG